MNRAFVTLAVAASVAAAFVFPAHAFCRGCVVEASALVARAEAPPPAAKCRRVHHRQTSQPRVRTARAEACGAH
jgi:hypothetical protein